MLHVGTTEWSGHITCIPCPYPQVCRRPLSLVSTPIVSLAQMHPRLLRDSRVVAKDGMEVSGDSIMGLLMLAASRGTAIEVTTSGTEAVKLADALEALVAARFGEDY